MDGRRYSSAGATNRATDVPIGHTAWGWLAWETTAGQFHFRPIAKRHHRQAAKIRAARLRNQPDIQRVWISRGRPEAQ